MFQHYWFHIKSAWCSIMIIIVWLTINVWGRTCCFPYTFDTILSNGTGHFKKCKTIVWIPTFTLIWRHLVVKVLIYILMLFIFSAPVLIRHLWQLDTVVFLHWYLICAVPIRKGLGCQSGMGEIVILSLSEEQRKVFSPPVKSNTCPMRFSPFRSKMDEIIRAEWL